MIEAGTNVGGYRVERLIGRGGMGVVYEAVQTSLDRRIALKVLRPELAEDPKFVERFWREGRLQASLEHPHVLDVYEVGDSEHGLFLSMRLVGGQTLLDLLRDGELSAERSLKLLDQVTGALDFAHEADLVHRDIKPQNILIGDGDHAFLADFGLTRGSTDTTVASTGPMLGSVAYVAPEIVRGEEPTPASDRYSFAATVFHCLTGDVLFPLGSDAAVLYAHAAQPPPRVAERRPELPEDLDAVMDAALSKEPASRPKTAKSIMRAVRDAIGPRVSQLGSPQAVGVFERQTALPPVPSLTEPDRSRKRVAAAAGLLLAVVALAVGAAFLIDGEEDTGAERPEVPVPAVAKGATALGSDLGMPDRSVGCDGEPATPETKNCAIVQSDLPGHEVLVPSDGVITGWTVRGAQGELAIDVIRPRGADTLRVARSQYEFVGNPGTHRFETELAVEAGDQIGLELGPGASIGVAETEGATTQRWIEPLGGAYGSPSEEEGTGFDYEMALRAEFVPGAEVSLPTHLVGDAAASAPGGKVRDRAFIEIENPRARLRLELAEVSDRVVLDVFKEGERTVRVFIPGLQPEGIPVKLKAFAFPGETYGEAGIWWVNPISGRLIFQFIGVSEEDLEYAG